MVFVDLHAAGIPHYLEGGFRHHHIYAMPVIKDLCHQLAGPDFVLASTDSGRMQWVESLAHDMGVGTSFVFKQRLDTAYSPAQAPDHFLSRALRQRFRVTRKPPRARESQRFPLSTL